MDKFLIGCCYYPEHWDEEDMREDLMRIKALGLNAVRMGEFSWSMFERFEGKYDFSFLRQAVEIADELGISVILGTPTAAPPKWLIDKHPEVLCKTAEGLTLHHGSRQHHNHTSEIYLDYCRKITEAMVKAFMDCKNVIGWQLDNEFNCHRNESYSESDDIAFRKWLKEKYGTIEEVNKAWGTRFWSLEFNSFDEVECQRKTTTHKNPALMTDYYLFLSDTVINYASVQTEVIRKYMPKAFITHNGIFANIDYKKLTQNCLDFLSFDSYPMFGERAEAERSRRWAHKLELTRGCSEKYMIMEQQSGPGGQLSYLLPTPLPGQIRLWTYQSIAHGAVGVLYFRYRTALYGAEQLWYGIYDHDKEENYRSKEVRQIAEELKRVGDIFLTDRQRNKAAILYDYHNICCNKAEPFFADDSGEIFVRLNNENIHADYIHSIDDLKGYKVLIVPHIAVINKEHAEKLEEFAKSGGIVIVSARSGIKDNNANYLPLKGPGILRKDTGCRVDWFTSVPDHSKQYVKMGEKLYPVSRYYEMLETEGGEAVAFYTEGFCKDKAAIVKNGNFYYVGFYADNCPELYTEIINGIIAKKESVDPSVEEITLGEHKIYLNYSNRKISFKAYDLLTETNTEEIPPYGVILT